MASDHLLRTRRAQAVPDESAMDYADLHHLTALPESIKKFKLKTFSLLGLEQALQQRINQHTSRDSDRFRQILRLFKEQTKRGDTDEDTALMGVNRGQFATILALLGLFATADQTNALFDKYDTNGDGALTVHEFLTRCRPADYVGARWHELREGGYGYQRGKKMFGDDTGAGALGGGESDETVAHASASSLARGTLTPRAPAVPHAHAGITGGRGTGRVRAATPSDALCHLTIERIAAKLRDKLRCRGPVGSTLSYPRERRHFAKTFEYYDREGKGSVSDEGLRHALDDINFPLGSTHRQLLITQFADKRDASQLDYVEFIRFVFPNDNCATSLQLGELESPPSAHGPPPMAPFATFATAPSIPVELSGGPLDAPAAGLPPTLPTWSETKEPSGSMSARGIGPYGSRGMPFAPRAPLTGSAPPTPSWGGSSSLTHPRGRPIGSSGSLSARGAGPAGRFGTLSGAGVTATGAPLPAVMAVGGRTFVRSDPSVGMPVFARAPLPPSSSSSQGSIRFG